MVKYIFETDDNKKWVIHGSANKKFWEHRAIYDRGK